MLVQGIDGVAQTNEVGDEFGFALGPFFSLGDPSSQAALAIGVPGEDDDTGAVVVVALNKVGGTFSANSSLEVRVDDIGGARQRGDRFGMVLSQPRAFPQPPFEAEE